MTTKGQHTEWAREIAWCAGFFDGEGCTSARRKPRKSGSVYRYPVIYVGQAGVEPLTRMRAALGVGRVSGPFRPYGTSKRPHWRYQIHGIHDVQAALAMMWAWLTTAKRTQATTVFQKVRDHGGLHV